jgi:hypothetical protein
LNGARDAAACARQLALEHSKIRGIQQTLFKDSVETFPEIKSDDVREAEERLDASRKADQKPQEIQGQSTSLKFP